MSETSNGGSSAESAFGPRQGSILLVDDREENLDAFEAVLAPLGHRIVRASTSDEALRVLLRDDFAVVLLDVRMPGTDGVETARLIKARVRSRSTPIIFITALDADRRRVSEAYASGAVDYLFKPVDPETLRAKVEAFVQLYEKRELLAWQERRRYADLVAQESEERLLADRLLARRQVDSVRRDISYILDSISDPFVVYDAEWRFRYVNHAAARTFSQAASPIDVSVIGQRLWDVFPHMRGTAIEREFGAAMVDRVPRSVEQLLPRVGWTEVQIYPIDDGGLAVVWKNISDRKKAEEALRFLTKASELFASSLDFEETLRAVAKLVVPGLAEWCGVEIVGEDGVPRQLAVEHSDPAKISLACELRERYPPPADAVGGVPYALRTGESQFHPEILDEQFVAAATDPDHLALLRSLELRSVIIVPFVARGRVFGALTIGSGPTRPRLTRDDLSLAEALARRAALAIDNAMLFREARRARAEAETANQAKSDFLATMSHELRTPLNAIAGYTELLEMELRGPVTDEQREDLRRIRRSQRHLLALVNDVLNFVRVDTGHVHYDIGDVDLGVVLADVETLVAPQFLAKGLVYELVPPVPGTTVRADPEKVQQILVNLLSNALKFTPTGGRVRIECRDGTSQMTIRVADTGRGIPAEQHAAIFEPFVQVDRALTRETEGSGLGLAISRQLAVAMSGDLTVESDLGSGSVFSLTLPRGEILPDA